MGDPGHVLLFGAILAVALVYSSVGHAGASGYIAVMILFGVPPDVIKPAALILNIAVACLGAWQFGRAGYFQWRLFWPLAALSVPAAFLGGYANLPVFWFKLLVGVVLLVSALRLLLRPPVESDPRPPALATALGTGAGLGLLSGFTGTGGGIFLTPLMLFRHWARTKNVAAVSAAFILVNSLAGLAGNLAQASRLPPVAWPLLGAALAGGAIGSHLGCRQWSVVRIKRVLALVLFLAGGKLILT